MNCPGSLRFAVGRTVFTCLDCGRTFAQGELLRTPLAYRVPRHERPTQTHSETTLAVGPL